ncbi:hypothetical protein QAD02_007221 [Eretmocerus hayati]|uniref:Uncharacterized protein n=1 Tax=Eretmocerus hayati TaxID=131215 RepID=A0ACC2N303_9HYME|nr:hypothetical protein QAD02_007221 [Eretmocerus hayati]
MTHACARNDLVGKRKHDENVLKIRHIETNGDKLLKTPKLENEFEHSRRVIYENEAQELRVTKIFDFKLQPRENKKSSNHEAGCKGKRGVEEIGERFARLLHVTSTFDTFQQKLRMRVERDFE